MNITLLGTGIYGLAIASALAKNKNKITMWTENKDKYEEYKITNNLNSICSEYTLPKNIKVTNNLEKAVKSADIIFITCASKYVENLTKSIKNFYNTNVPVCIASKGIEEESCRLLSNVVKNNLKTNNIAVISGPTFAIDVIRNEPVALALAAKNKKTYKLICASLANETLKLRKSSDIIGIQICGSVKNIIAIASGILGGLGYSESTQAFLINESLHDIKDLISFLGGKQKTILSFAGVGDLLMTSMSKKSRNYSYGFTIGSKGFEEGNDFLKSHTVEGYFTVKTVIKLLNKKNIDIPLIYLINDIIDGKKSAKDLANFLIIKK